MATLSDILQNAMKISTLASRFGFSGEISIFNDGSYQRGNRLTLTLVVIESPQKYDGPHCANLLAIKLSDELDCKVKVLSLQKTPQNSASIFDEVAVCELFRIDFADDVVMKGNEGNKQFSADGLKAADQYLAEQAKGVVAEEAEEEKEEAKEAAKKKFRY